jgi:hypothetical protein
MIKVTTAPAIKLTISRSGRMADYLDIRRGQDIDDNHRGRDSVRVRKPNHRAGND